MRIVFAISDTRRKNLVFSMDNLKAYSLKDSIMLVRKGRLESVHEVKTGQGSYIRANPNTDENDNLDAISISANHFYLAIKDFTCLLSPKKFKSCMNHLELHFSMTEERGEAVIYVENHPLITREQVIEKIAPHKKLILAAAKEFSVDPNTLGAIIIDEIVRANPWEEALDKLGSVYVADNTSVGLAQVKIKTARELIKKNYYNPNPDDIKLSSNKMSKTHRAYLYAYVVQPRHNIRFAAARIRQTIDYWAYKIDLSNRPEIIGTLYSQGLGEPKTNPRSSDRGLQIAQEFYPLFKFILNQP